jgi:hypothetical protein
MKRKYLCVKNWEVDSGIYFKKGNYYDGKLSNNKTVIKMNGEVGMVINFQTDSEYFKTD